ncbi:glycine-tRNA ligase [Acididesulfobacillus acetoxydans]|uniref:Glycine--tRNA ligase beta subunit n=1 Tax=Acididesulfobacillus acetoxydans TaxID=1561005 RepID=A0A8S0VYY1_9FIRM|nr:glycine--tRNA ligase subunit beta [Acididesulfobacillus acetoxydans]CAA7603463.1 glycine-tRNA ligase [Acididesulfobacillus acetoxydans]CEJ06834.1 Glycine--tRNA ligase beta subunit [Acididesulfobacillus acetoxydans]
MARDFVLEIGTEEIPAKFAPDALVQLADQARQKLGDLRLAFRELKTYSTPRRLALVLKDLEEKQEDLQALVKGPALKSAYDAGGKPTKAAQGFARAQGVRVEDLFVREVNGASYVFARKAEAGRPTLEILPTLCPDLIIGLRFPKPMRWGDSDFRFARPIRWLMALYGSEVVPFELVGLVSGRFSRGHRTLSDHPVELVSAGDYPEVLRKAFVLADPEERGRVIRDQIRDLAAACGGKAEEDEELLTEVVNLVEYPTALRGEVAQRYMHLPEAVITTPMREHQRYFPVHAADGSLLSYFITVRDGDDYALTTVRQGNEKVLKARLEDAAFYYREDRKIPLADHVPKLEKVVYHEKLGTVRERVERLRVLARFTGGKLGLGGENTEIIDRTAYLAKADLVTLMVYDFPELQGVMGADYAAASGEKAEVCQGIAEHYQPRFAGDVLPASAAGRVVSLADKLDAIVGAFAIGIQPTGSQDPYALRRQAQGIVGILLDAEWDLSLSELCEQAYRGFEALDSGLRKALLPLSDILPGLLEFFRQRLRFLLQEDGLLYDTVDAVMVRDEGFFFRTARKAKELAARRQSVGFAAYTQAYTRCLNLSKKEKPQVADAKRLVDPSEIALSEGIGVRRERFDNLVEAEKYGAAYELAAELVPMIEALFDAVMIMAEDEDLRKARLALLGQCVEMLGCLGDLSRLTEKPGA